MTVNPDFYPHIIVKGDPFQRGLSHGQQLKYKIQQLANHYLTEADIPKWSFCEHIIQNYYMPALEKYDPTAYDEIKGIAEGSELPIEQIFLINARYDLTKYKNNKEDLYKMKDDSECTAATIIDETGVKIAQNWDLDAYVFDHDLCVILEAHTEDYENLPKTIITLGEVGQLGRSGMNSKGLGLCANSLNSNTDSFDFPKPGPTLEHPAVIPISFARRKYLSCHNYANGLKYIVGAPRHVGGNVMVATKEREAIDFELIPQSYFTIYPTFVDEEGRECLPHSNGRAVLVHSNHFVSSGYSPAAGVLYCRNPGGSSLYRHRRILTRIVDAFRETPRGKGISTNAVKESFSDRACAPCALSESKNARSEPANDEVLMTVASVVYDLTKGVMTVCKGPPHVGKWKEYKINLE